MNSIFAAVEDHHFTFEINLASGQTLFWKIMENNKAFQKLQIYAFLGDNAKKDIIKRLDHLSKNAGDPQFSHPHDCAIAAYAWSLKDHPIARMEAIDIIRNTDGLWWSILVCNKLFEINQ